jgi:hypothetical protein
MNPIRAVSCLHIFDQMRSLGPSAPAMLAGIVSALSSWS